jgi:hypothetical protein
MNYYFPEILSPNFNDLKVFETYQYIEPFIFNQIKKLTRKADPNIQLKIEIFYNLSEFNIESKGISILIDISQDTTYDSFLKDSIQLKNTTIFAYKISSNWREWELFFFWDLDLTFFFHNASCELSDDFLNSPFIVKHFEEFLEFFELNGMVKSRDFISKLELNYAKYFIKN